MSNEEGWIASFSGQPPDSRTGDVTDLEALHRREDIRILPLQRPTRAMLERLTQMGSLDCTTGNLGATCTRREQVGGILATGEGILLFGEPGSLRWLDQSSCHSVAVLSKGQDFTDTPPCLLLFGETGGLAHQITLWDPATWEGFIDLVCHHRGCWNCLRQQADRTGFPTPAGCPAWMIKEAWSGAGSERDLELRLERLGLDRATAVRAMEGLFTTPVDIGELAALLTELASSRLPVHLQLGNRHCTQVLESPLQVVSLTPQAWEIQMAQTTLHVRPGRIDSAWSVVLRQSGRERHRFECFDAAGGQVLTLSSPLESCSLVADGWNQLIGRFEARCAVRGVELR